MNDIASTGDREATVVTDGQDADEGRRAEDGDRGAGRIRRSARTVRVWASRRRRVLLVTTFGLALAVALGAAVVHVLVVRSVQQADRAGIEGLAAARTVTEQVLSYQPATQDGDIGRARGLVTGPFGQQFGTVLDSVVRPALKAGIGTRTSVTRAGIVSAEPDRVDVLVYLTQEAGRAGDDPRTNQSRAEVVVDRVDGRWLVSDLRNF